MSRLAPVLCLFSAVLLAQQPAGRQFAGLEQDVAELRTELAKLSQQMADLDQAVRSLRAQPAAAPQGASREAILAEVDRRNTALRADLDRALAAFTKQVNQALATRVATPAPTAPPAALTADAVAPANPADTAAPANPALPPDMPRTGIRYKVRAGDTLSGIARRHQSRVDWILKANQMQNPDALRVDDEILIPQP